MRIASSSIWERREVWRSAGVLKRGVRKRKAQRMVLSSWAEVREARRRARRMARRQSSWWENVKGESRFCQVVSWESVYREMSVAGNKPVPLVPVVLVLS